MRSTLAPQLIIGALVIAAVVLGVMATGGLGAGKMEKRDRARIADLRDLSDFVHCVAKGNNHQLPEKLSPDENCDNDTPFVDRFTGQPYSYEKISAPNFRLCPQLERPEVTGSFGIDGSRFNVATGCITISYTRKP